METIKTMINSLKSNSIIIEGGNLETITFNPFDIMGVAFLSCYDLSLKDNDIKIFVGGNLYDSFSLSLKGKVIIDFDKPILLNKNTRIEILTTQKAYVHYHIFTPSDREKKIYEIY